MDISDLGYYQELESSVSLSEKQDYIIARVIQQHKERYLVSTGEREIQAETTGNLRFCAEESTDLPAVGDWVLINIFDNDLAIIHKILPRKTILERQAIDKFGEKQVIATNIDVALIVQSIDNNFNINRIERYLTISYNTGIKPIVIITKIDKSPEYSQKDLMLSFNERNIRVPIIAISNVTKDGYDEIYRILKPKLTYCVIGSSGVGKSSLINNLKGEEILKTGEISKSTSKGRHVTSSRQMIILDNGSILVDTPGMRELGITESLNGLMTTFEDIYSLSKECKFSDCTHTNEMGCAVLKAVKEGKVNEESLVNFKKMEREHQRFLTTHVEKRKKDKEFGKMVKRIMKEKNQNKY